MTTSSSSPGPTSTARRWPGPPRSRGSRPGEWTDQLAPRFAEAWTELDISNDDFIRTTEPRHHRAVQEFLGRIHDNGFIFKDTYRGLYCVSCEQYYAEDELVEGQLCPIHRTPVEHLEEENYFFRLSAFEERLIEWYEANPTRWCPSRSATRPSASSRGASGTSPSPGPPSTGGCGSPGTSEHVFYVWYDALINYLTAIGYGEDPERFEQWWPAVHHLIGKEIIRFHCVWWPAMCMAAGIDPPAHVQVHGWLLLGGEKMSNSSVNQIAPADLIAEYGVDPVRYHLLRDIPLGSDGEFSAEGITARYNTDLANNLGNLLSRVATVVGSKCGGVGPAPRADSRLAGVAAAVLAEATEAWDAGQPNLALEATWRLIRETNAELEQAEPWKADPGPAVDAVLGSALEVLRIVSILIVPAMPATAETIWARIGLEGSPAAQRAARRRGLGRLSGRSTGGEGCTPLPPAQGLSGRPVRRRRGRVVRLPLPPPGRVHRGRWPVTGSTYGPTPPAWPPPWPGPRRPG